MPDAPVHDQFALDGAWNFRDLGGVRTTDGATVRPGLFYRASELSGLTEVGQRVVADLGIRTVFDFRGDAEAERSGVDRVPAGVESISVPYENLKGERAPHEAAPILDEQSQVDYMMRAYASFSTLDGASHAIKRVVDEIVGRRGGVLVHCAAGKDRAGWTVATVLRAAGVDEDDIVADYLRSNDAMEPLLAHVRRTWAGLHDVLPTEAILGVRASYLEHGWATMESNQGSFGGYLTHLGIDRDLRQRLTAALVQG
ncbi:tyrosine-protein phosphatase [Rhodococcus sp. IEGM 1401]|uniref:tyrosine-protein phosphatase n=1 Tax=unclassified Rhodococcus (in: high G+C Gram-positive bacteria) TaxID=192944 RepID=UPI0022B45D5A|nr:MULTISPECIES: tyrosine-protein phosphatase [unclassified Rhodococcus (in: high G+C Gram-positive bacteria)]MCZ4560582.1 tyrosine-protein phosphatase [Rhodococcus sp. IEGM 1401]MDI9920710.1 tyrosine-protein phosphatase [Rhodococcus sp. IEGM 1372]MDV8033254.1 tyrosine-protein phosphatase [Rhodococcus sp. IEGM 1414]MDV8075379.1 tyrosine-protein phosphatase [Rhodococcus sp. IEGM 1370]